MTLEEDGFVCERVRPFLLSKLIVRASPITRRLPLDGSFLARAPFPQSQYFRLNKFALHLQSLVMHGYGLPHYAGTERFVRILPGCAYPEQINMRFASNAITDALW